MIGDFQIIAVEITRQPLGLYPPKGKSHDRHCETAIRTTYATTEYRVRHAPSCRRYTDCTRMYRVPRNMWNPASSD